MKKVIVLLFLFCFLPGFAQSDLLRGEIHTQAGFPSKSFKPYEIVGIIGFNITDRFFINVRGERTIALFDIGGTKDHYTNEIYGVNAGYTFLKTDMCNVDARLGFGDNVRKKKDWRYNSYDAGVYMHVGKSKFKPVFGVGVRRYHSRNDMFKSYTRFFVSLGMGVGG